MQLQLVDLYVTTEILSISVNASFPILNSHFSNGFTQWQVYDETTKYSHCASVAWRLSSSAVQMDFVVQTLFSTKQSLSRILCVFSTINEESGKWWKCWTATLNATSKRQRKLISLTAVESVDKCSLAQSTLTEALEETKYYRARRSAWNGAPVGPWVILP